MTRIHSPACSMMLAAACLIGVSTPSTPLFAQGGVGLLAKPLDEQARLVHEVGVVVQDEGQAELGEDGDESTGGGEDFVFRKIFGTKLEDGGATLGEFEG